MCIRHKTVRRRGCRWPFGVGLAAICPSTTETCGPVCNRILELLWGTVGTWMRLQPGHAGRAR